MSTAAANGVARPADYLAAGLSIIPIRADGTKAPAISSWKQYQSELASAEEAGRWFIFDNVGVAVIHGAVSGNSELIDIDNGDVFGPYCAEVERVAPGLISKLTIIQTPRPGYHIVYRCDNVEGNQKLAMSADRKVLIETRGQGGYALAPGSPAECHETRRTYEHHSGPKLTELPMISPEDRGILLRVAASFNELVEECPSTRSSSHQVTNGVSPGDDFNQRADWLDILTPHGWDVAHSSGDKTFWRRPGKAVGWSATTGIKSPSGNELFCCFSDNAHPFQGANGRNSCSTYTKFAAYAVLNHNGDYSAAAKQLVNDGYGERNQAPSKIENVSNSIQKQDDAENAYRREPIQKFTFAELKDQYRQLHEPLVDNLARLAETVNIVSASKIGKSWLVYYLLLCIIFGQELFGKFRCSAGKVLLIDNELHKPTLVSRIVRVAEAMGIFAADFEDQLEIWPLRGNLRTLSEIEAELNNIAPGEFQAIVFDARYRFALDGESENDNAQQAMFYNQLDRIAEMTGATLFLVHHSTKGDQAGKRITDVGAGAGSQSRAADCHLILREHTEENHIVLEAAVRSFAPVEPLTLKWEFPLWIPVELDPADLKGSKTRQTEQQERNDREGKLEIASILAGGPATASKIRKGTSYGASRVDRLLALMVRAGEITTNETQVKGNTCDEFALTDSQK